MEIHKHGLTIGLERTGNEFFLSLKAQGKLTHEDYEVITPFIDSALSEVKAPQVKMFVDITELDGWEARAAWDDFKIGLKHGNEFVKVAIYGHKKWQSLAATVGSWFIAGEIKSFEKENEALDWLHD